MTTLPPLQLCPYFKVLYFTSLIGVNHFDQLGTMVKGILVKDRLEEILDLYSHMFL